MLSALKTTDRISALRREEAEGSLVEVGKKWRSVAGRPQEKKNG